MSDELSAMNSENNYPKIYIRTVIINLNLWAQHIDTAAYALIIYSKRYIILFIREAL